MDVYLMGGLKTGYCAQKSNKDVADTVIRIQL